MLDGHLRLVDVGEDALLVGRLVLAVVAVLGVHHVVFVVREIVHCLGN